MPLPEDTNSSRTFPTLEDQEGRKSSKRTSCSTRWWGGNINVYPCPPERAPWPTTSSGSRALLNAWKAQSCPLRPGRDPSFRFSLPLRKTAWTFLVVQWLIICLPVQGTWVWSLVWEIFTCCRATKPALCNYWAQAPRATAMTSLRRATKGQPPRTTRKSPRSNESQPSREYKQMRNKEPVAQISKVYIVCYTSIKRQF